eukprot:10562815-Alexandrium_andersonii.AAC.1
MRVDTCPRGLNARAFALLHAYACACACHVGASASANARSLTRVEVRAHARARDCGLGVLRASCPGIRPRVLGARMVEKAPRH